MNRLQVHFSRRESLKHRQKHTPSILLPQNSLGRLFHVSSFLVFPIPLRFPSVPLSFPQANERVNELERSVMINTLGCAFYSALNLKALFIPLPCFSRCEGVSSCVYVKLFCLFPCGGCESENVGVRSQFPSFPLLRMFPHFFFPLFI